MTATVQALGEEFSFSRLIGIVSILADKDVDGVLELLEPVLAEIVITRNSSPRAMSAAKLSELAIEIFGEDRVHVRVAMPDAIELAVELAESDPDFALSGVGILITGSVVTVADARTLLQQ